MPRLIYDTETTGFAQFGQPFNHPSQPRMLQLAGILVNDDWQEMSSFSFYIDREGFDIPAKISEFHGITNELVDDCGIPMMSALSVLMNLSYKAECWAFNSKFDEFIIKNELHRIGKHSVVQKFKSKCAMMACKDIVKMPGRGGQFKWPKLSEAYAHFFDGATFADAHNALGDVRATVSVLKATLEHVGC